MNKQLNIFLHTTEGVSQSMRLTLDQAIETTKHSLNTVAQEYDHWMVGFSGGKDSTATVTLIDWLIKTDQVNRPKSLIVNYNDTLMELPPLEIHAHNLLDKLEESGWKVFRTTPKLQYKTKKGIFTSGRFMVLMLGVGYAPPNSSFTWCRQRMKLDSASNLIDLIKSECPGSLIGIDGVRIGESIVRDRSIYATCKKNDGECGTTILRQVPTMGDKLSPIAHWRVCHVWDWLFMADFEYGYHTSLVAEIYGADISDGLEDLSARTGCMGCPLVTAQDAKQTRPDKALLRVVKMPQWAYLSPLLQLGHIYWTLKTDKKLRYQWDSSVKGNPRRHGMVGALTIDARKWALSEIQKIELEVNQQAILHNRPKITLIRKEELDLILQLQDAGHCPEGWSMNDPTGADVLTEMESLPLFQLG